MILIFYQERMEEKMSKWIVTEDENNIRIDRYISDKLPEISRSYIQKLIKDTHVTANDQTPTSWRFLLPRWPSPRRAS